jgi:hypothetical protein
MIVKSFPEDIVKDTVQELVKIGTLIKSPRNDRVIPGTRNALSAKFMTRLAGDLPSNLFDQAKEFDKFLNQQETKIIFQKDTVSSGMMACLLDLMSQEKVFTKDLIKKTTQLNSIFYVA